VGIEDIPEIEKIHNISIKVYQATKKDANYSIKLVYANARFQKRSSVNNIVDAASSRFGKTKINMLLYNEHYMLIKNINTLLRQFTARNGKKSNLSPNYRERKMYCEFCGTSSFTKKASLEAHEKRCQENKQEIVLPKTANSCLSFKNFDHKIRVPFKIFADFESYFEVNENTNLLNSTAQVKYLKKHKMMGWGFKVVSSQKYGVTIMCLTVFLYVEQKNRTPIRRKNKSECTDGPFVKCQGQLNRGRFYHCFDGKLVGIGPSFKDPQNTCDDARRRNLFPTSPNLLFLRNPTR